MMDDARQMPIRLTLLAYCALASLALAAEPAPEERARKETELRGVETNLKASDDELRTIEADVEAIKLDRTRLNAALLETTARLQKSEADRADATARLAKAGADAAALEKSTAERRKRIGELLAALQRLTHDAPPAILVAPDDMAQAVRAAGVLGGLVSDIKLEADSLGRDLAKIIDLGRQIEDERRGLAASAQTLAVDKARLDALIDARQKSLLDRAGALDAERRRADQLAQQAGNLKDLIGRMDGDAAAADAADRAAAAAVESRAALHGGGPARLKPAIAFAEMKGRLAWPAVGTPARNYGDPDGYGGQNKGISVKVAQGAVVSAPADSWVAFAGPYRSYGQLLILNAGEGYYVVLAGMERILVSVGQFVLAGEPVAIMGTGGNPGSGGTKTAAAGSIGADPPILYIEFRKNDAVIDPQPWWAKSNTEKARG
jgi:septal ring factor EnvC (AmiA/AmiB activator)